MDILITGGTGAFGQALVAKLLDGDLFTRICIYSRDEHKQQLMRERFNDDGRLRFFIGDIRDKDRLKLALHNVYMVVHAAALKIVPTAEYNPMEYIKTNVIGAQNLIDAIGPAALSNSCPTKVLAISTDKAVDPVNLYGATKLCAEKLFRASNNVHGPHGPKYSILRYGNVANSTGSVVPKFAEMLARGKQIEITHPDMTRFWITLDYATDLALRCLDIMYGGEVFVPEMPAFNISDLARVMYTLAGWKLEDSWPRVIGIRRGEKLHERIISEHDFNNVVYNFAHKLYIIQPAEWERAKELKDLLPEDIQTTSNLARRMDTVELRDNLISMGFTDGRTTTTKRTTVGGQGHAGGHS